MKKFTFLSLILLAITFTNCKKDSDDGNEQQDSPKPVPVTINEVDYSSRPTTYTFKNLVKTIDQVVNQNTEMKNSLQTDYTTNYEYDTGRVFTKRTTTVGSDVYVDEYYYKDKSKGLLDSIVSRTNNAFSGVQIYTVTNDKVQQIISYDENRQMDSQISFTYTGNKVSSFVINSNGIPYNGTLTYSGDNISNLLLEVPGFLIMSVDYTYDDKNNPMNNVKTIESPITVANNVLTAVTEINYQGATDTSTVTYDYNYNNDNYPIQSTETSNGNISKTAEYIYEDKN